MKNLYFFLALLMVSAKMVAQPTITNASFPVIGDMFHIASTSTIGNFSLEAAGGPRYWDLIDLEIEAEQIQEYKDPSLGSGTFPGADILATLEGVGEAYLDVTTNKVTVLGVVSDDPFGTGANATASYSPPLLFRQTPIAFGTEFNNTANITFPFSAAALGMLLDSLPFQLDSIRFRVETKQSQFADGYGKMRMPNQFEYDVLRVRDTEIQTTKVEIKTGFFPWIDITTLFPIPGVAGIDTTVSYKFFTPTFKQELAIVYIDNTTLEPVSIDFVAGLVSSTQELQSDGSTITWLNNPANENTKLRFTPSAAGKVEMSIWDISGRIVQTQAINAQAGITQDVSVPIDGMPKGLYFAVIRTPQGQIIGKSAPLVRP